MHIYKKMEEIKKISGWISYENNKDLKKYYENKYKCQILINYGLETKRNGKIGINYNVLLIPNSYS